MLQALDQGRTQERGRLPALDQGRTQQRGKGTSPGPGAHTREREGYQHWTRGIYKGRIGASPGPGAHTTEGEGDQH